MPTLTLPFWTLYAALAVILGAILWVSRRFRWAKRLPDGLTAEDVAAFVKTGVEVDSKLVRRVTLLEAELERLNTLSETRYKAMQGMMGHLGGRPRKQGGGADDEDEDEIQLDPNDKRQMAFWATQQPPAPPPPGQPAPGSRIVGLQRIVP